MQYNAIQIIAMFISIWCLKEFIGGSCQDNSSPWMFQTFHKKHELFQCSDCWQPHSYKYEIHMQWINNCVEEKTESNIDSGR